MGTMVSWCIRKVIFHQPAGSVDRESLEEVIVLVPSTDINLYEYLVMWHLPAILKMRDINPALGETEEK